MKTKRKIGVLILIIFIVIQFVQPKKNASDTLGKNDISMVYSVPSEIHQTLVTKCYDCHSNNTKYPWYSHLQPIGWWLAAHVHDGKEELNFSEFKTYPNKKSAHKLEEITEVLEDGSMPLKPYTLLHNEAKITVAEMTAINGWIKSLDLKK
jgi:hypothetical protein